MKEELPFYIIIIFIAVWFSLSPTYYDYGYVNLVVINKNFKTIRFTEMGGMLHFNY